MTIYIDLSTGQRLGLVCDLHGRPVQVREWTDEEKAQFAKDFAERVRKVSTRIPVVGEDDGKPRVS